MSLEGRLDHRDHQRAYRLRGGGVSDHTSQGQTRRLCSTPDDHETLLAQSPPARIPRFGVCCKCGRRGIVALRR